MRASIQQMQAYAGSVLSLPGRVVGAAIAPGVGPGCVMIFCEVVAGIFEPTQVRVVRTSEFYEGRHLATVVTEYEALHVVEVA